MRALAIIRERIEGVVPLDSRLYELMWQSVRALIACKQLTLTAVARALERDIAPKHRIKAVDRFLGNPRLQAVTEKLCGALLQTLLPKRSPSSLTILIDWTQLDAKHYALVAAVPIEGRAQPILAHVHPSAKQGTRQAHRKFLNALSVILPPGICPLLITDAGFESTWFEEVEKRNWDYVGRLRHRTTVRRAGSAKWISNKALHTLATRKPRDLGLHEFPRTHPGARRLVLASRQPKGRVELGRRGRKLRRGLSRRHAAREREPWLLATSLAAEESGAEYVVHEYAERMKIEETFRDAKNPRFGWSMRFARASSPDRLEVLFLLASLAFAVVTATGIAAEAAGLHRSQQANTVKRRVLSLFVLGNRILQEKLSVPTRLLARVFANFFARRESS